jgi:Lon protease-like protein
MAHSIFDPSFDELPTRIPIFPLPSALLLPGGQIPLNVFEPRYLAMVTHALASPTRLIGMVQPFENNGVADLVDDPALFDTGCAGRLSFFSRK